VQAPVTYWGLDFFFLAVAGFGGGETAGGGLFATSEGVRGLGAALLRCGALLSWSRVGPSAAVVARGGENPGTHAGICRQIPVMANGAVRRRRGRTASLGGNGKNCHSEAASVLFTIRW
jgi:hypothetical protein